MLVGEERQMYHLIAMRFISAFYPDCEFSTTTVLAESADVPFKTSGKVIVKPGWRVLFSSDGKNSGDDNVSAGGDDESILPEFIEGESGSHEPSLQKNRHSRPNHTQKEHCCAPWNLPVKRWMTRNFGKQ